MGLDTTHDAWHGAYSAFARWRQKLAEVAGIPDYLQMSIKLDVDANLQGDWGRHPDETLWLLLAHSDCDGYLKPREAEAIANRLEELLPLLDGDGGGHVGSYREKTQQFIDGLRAAVAAGEVVEFW